MRHAPLPTPQRATAQDDARAAWDRADLARAAGDADEACRWLERAHRLVPDDALVRLTFGATLLELGRIEEATPLLDGVARDHDLPEAWAALAACYLARGQEAPCVEALERALRAVVPTPALAALAGRVAERFARAGWCGLDGAGLVHSGPRRPARILLDGAPIRGARLPSGWQNSRLLELYGQDGPLLGSPLPMTRVRAVQGFVEARDGGIEGWAWHPSDPGRDPLILVRGARSAAALTATDPAEDVEHLRPLARPRRFTLAPEQVRAMGHPLSVTDADGRHLLGSPLGEPVVVPAWAGSPGGAPAVDPRPREVDVVIPVYRGAAETIACLDAVLASVPASTRVHVIDDGSPEPELVAAIEALAAAGRIGLLRQAHNRGFPAAANAGLRAAAGRDVVLLNSDTLVAPGWLDRLRRAAYSAPEVGSATPLSNDATIVSYPAPDGSNPAPDLAGTAALDALAAAANPGQTAILPVGVGFCLYLRRDCLEQVGLFREDLFAQGYGEENDLCLRARPRRVAARRGARRVRSPCGRALVRRRPGAPSPAQHRHPEPAPPWLRLGDRRACDVRSAVRSAAAHRRAPLCGRALAGRLGAAGHACGRRRRRGGDRRPLGGAAGAGLAADRAPARRARLPDRGLPQPALRASGRAADIGRAAARGAAAASRDPPPARPSAGGGRASGPARTPDRHLGARLRFVLPARRPGRAGAPLLRRARAVALRGLRGRSGARRGSLGSPSCGSARPQVWLGAAWSRPGRGTRRSGCGGISRRACRGASVGGRPRSAAARASAAVRADPGLRGWRDRGRERLRRPARLRARRPAGGRCRSSSSCAATRKTTRACSRPGRCSSPAATSRTRRSG